MVKTADPVPRFNLRDDDPTYATWDDKVRELKAQESKLDREESDLLGRLSSTRNPSDQVNRAVASLLGDEVNEADPAVDGLRQRLTALQAERRDVIAARAIAEQRRLHARHAASAKITARVAETYKKHVREMAASLIAAHQANKELWHLTGALNDANVMWVGALRPVPASRMLGEPNDPTNRVSSWLKEAAEYGLIDRKIIPEDLA